MGAAKTAWTEGDALSVRGVLAGAYRGGDDGRSGGRACVTHAVRIDAEGWETGEKTLCGRIDLERLVDYHGMVGTTHLAAPTCPGCARKAARA